MDFHIFLTDYQPLKNRSNAISGNPTWKTSVIVAALSHLRIPVSTKRTCKKHAADFSDHPGSRSARFAYHPKYPTVLLNSAPSSRIMGFWLFLVLKVHGINQKVTWASRQESDLPPTPLPSQQIYGVPKGANAVPFLAPQISITPLSWVVQLQVWTSSLLLLPFPIKVYELYW